MFCYPPPPDFSGFRECFPARIALGVFGTPTGRKIDFFYIYIYIVLVPHIWHFSPKTALFEISFTSEALQPAEIKNLLRVLLAVSKLTEKKEKDKKEKRKSVPKKRLTRHIYVA